MSKITILWNDVNLIESGHRVYRDTKPLDIDNLPAIYAVANNTNNYVDYNYVTNNTYYYIIESIHSGVKSYSRQISISV